MLSVFDTRVTHNFQRQHAVTVLALDQTQNSELVDTALQRELVVTGLEEEVGNKGVADLSAVDGEVHGDISEIERHDRGVGNADIGD